MNESQYDHRKSINPLLLTSIVWAIFITLVLLYTDSIPINNYYDVEHFFTVDVFLPAIPVLLGMILLQKRVGLETLIILLAIINLVLLWIAGFIILEFASYNGDTLMYHFGYFMIYYRHLFSTILACILSEAYLTSFHWILKLRTNNIQPAQIGRILLKQSLGGAIFIYIELWLAFEYALGICFLIAVGSIGIGIMDALKQHKVTTIQALNDMEKSNKISCESWIAIQSSSRFKNSVLMVIFLVLPLLWGYTICIDFFRLTDFNGEGNVTMYFTINIRMVIQELMLGILQFIVIGYMMKSVLGHRMRGINASPKLERNLAFLTVGLTAMLFGCLAIGVNPLPIRYVSLFLPWILFVMVVWLLVFFVQRKVESPGLLGLYISIGSLAVWAGIALASEASSDYMAIYFVLILLLVLILLILVYLVAPSIKLNQTKSISTELKKSDAPTHEPAIEKQKETSIQLSQATNIRPLRWNPKVTALCIIAVFCISFIPIGVVNYSNDGYQLLANVDDQAIFYLVDPTSRISQNYKPQFGMSMYKNPNGEFTINAARNEYEAVQIVMRPLYQVSFSVYSISFSGFTSLTDPDIKINNTNFAAYTVEYIPELAYIVADRLVPFYPRGVSEMVNTPFWLNFYIPGNSAPGDYSGRITFHVDNKIDPNGWYPQKAVQFNVSLHVYNFTLPTVPTLKSNFGYSNTQYYNETMGLFKSHRMMKWAFAHLPTCSLLADGSVQSMNFTSFDAEMDYYHSIGTYTVGIHASSYSSALPTGNFTVDGQVYSAANYSMSPKYNQTFLEYFDFFESYLKGRTYLNEFGDQKSWFDEVYINAPDEIQAASESKIQAAIREYDWLKNIVKCGLPLMQTIMGDVDGRMDIIENVDILCWHTQGFEEPLITEWKAKGKEVWIYTTCGPRFPAPSMSTAVMALQVRALGWQCFVYNYSHYLIWDVATPGNQRGGYGYGSWNGGSFLYTSPTGYYQSTRLELIREGFEDYEYFVLLQRTIEKINATNSTDPRISAGLLLLDQVDKLFTQYNPNMDYRAFGQLRHQIGLFLADISVIS